LAANIFGKKSVVYLSKFSIFEFGEMKKAVSFCITAHDYLRHYKSEHHFLF